MHDAQLSQDAFCRYQVTAFHKRLGGKSETAESVGDRTTVIVCRQYNWPLTPVKVVDWLDMAQTQRLQRDDGISGVLLVGQPIVKRKSDAACSNRVVEFPKGRMLDL